MKKIGNFILFGFLGGKIAKRMKVKKKKFELLAQDYKSLLI